MIDKGYFEMSGKSKNRRAKYSQSKKVRSKRQYSPTSAQPSTVTETGHAVTAHEVVNTPAVMSASHEKSPVIGYQFIFTELRSIGILAGIMLILLVVLYFVLG